MCAVPTWWRSDDPYNHFVFLHLQPLVVFVPVTVCISSGFACTFTHLITRLIIKRRIAKMQMWAADWPLKQLWLRLFPVHWLLESMYGIFDLSEVSLQSSNECSRCMRRLRGSGVHPAEPGSDKLQPALNETGRQLGGSVERQHPTTCLATGTKG